MKDLKNMPNHIAFIIDGNGRWAKARGLSRSLGHKAGIKTLKNRVKDCFDLGIKVVSVYGFSTENWNRPQQELDGLFELFENFLKSNKFKFGDHNVRLNIMGDYTKFPKSLVDSIEKTLEKTKNNTEFVVNLGINYGGRDEIVRAVNNIINDKLESVDKDTFNDYLYTKGLSDPDLIVRTSGELRISNFMLWQCAYSEWHFPKVGWPAYSKSQLEKSLVEFSKRNRRFGAIKEDNDEKKS